MPPAMQSVPTAKPGDWIGVGDFGLDVGELTLEQRAELIYQLQLSSMRFSLKHYELVDGRKTTRGTPCYKGQGARFEQMYYDNNFGQHTAKVTMALLDILRGEEAEAITAPLFAAGIGGSELSPALEYAVCTFEIFVEGSNQGDELDQELIYFSMFDFVSTNSSGKILPNTVPFTGVDNTINLNLGGSGTLQVVLPVEKSDRAPQVCYRQEIWFSLLEPE